MIQVIVILTGLKIHIIWRYIPLYLNMYYQRASVGCFLDNSDLDLTYGYVAEEIEQSWYGGGGDDNDDSTDVEGVVLMNFDIFSLFAIMFGMDVGIEHPMIMTVSDSYAIVGFKRYYGWLLWRAIHGHF